MDKYQDPDVLDAPLNLTCFEIIDKENKVLPEIQAIKGNLGFTVRFAIHVPQKFIHENLNFGYKVYMTISTIVDGKELGIWQSIGDLPLQIDSSKHPLIYRYDFPVNIDVSNIIDQLKEVKIQLSTSSKHNGESGISESLRVGRFLYTKIPVVVNEDNE